jgi:hypothetical protein
LLNILIVPQKTGKFATNKVKNIHFLHAFDCLLTSESICSHGRYQNEMSGSNTELTMDICDMTLLLLPQMQGKISWSVILVVSC